MPIDKANDERDPTEIAEDEFNRLADESAESDESNDSDNPDSDDSNDDNDDTDVEESNDSDADESDGDDEELPPEVKQWDGRLQKTREELSEAQRKLAETQRQIEEAKAKAKPPEKDNDPETDEENFFEQMPEYGDDVRAEAKRIAEEANKPLQDQLQQLQQERTQIHMDAIESAHPNWREEYVDSGDIWNWIDELPKKTGDKYEQVLKSGNSQAVIGVFDEFKNSKETPSAERKRPPVSKRRNNTAPSPKKNKGEMSYEEAWEHHSKQEA